MFSYTFGSGDFKGVTGLLGWAADSVVYHRLGLKLLHLRVASTNPEAFITQGLQVQTLKP